MTSDDDLNLAVDAAHAAGKILLEFWSDRANLQIKSKRAGDFVSAADVSAENLLRKILLGARPGDGWLGEETDPSGSGTRRWIVDPLDGTTNFLRGIPHWSVSIALEVEGELTVGVVHDPAKSETFSAQVGNGAYLNSTRLEVAQTSSMSSALFGTGVPFGNMAHIDDHAREIARLMPLCAGIRRMGSAALDLAYVAAGRFDGFWERSLQPWDISAGLVLLRESGAVVQGWIPDERPEKTGTVMTATPVLFEAFSEVLRVDG